MRIRMLRTVLLALLVLPTAVAAQDAAPSPNSGSASLLPGDLLRIEIWREPDLGGEFVVDSEGDVVLPLLGERAVAGIPIAELNHILSTEYRRHLRNPSIRITPLRRVYMLGEVNRPGLLTLDLTVSLAGAIALAGGINPIGDIQRITVIRDGTAINEGMLPTHQLAEMDLRSGDQILVGRRSWFDRNSTFVVSALLSVTSIVITLIM